MSMPLCESKSKSKLILTVDWTRVTQGNGIGPGGYQGYAIEATMELAKGNQIRILLVEGASHDNIFRYTNLVGQLIEEEIVEQQ